MKKPKNAKLNSETTLLHRVKGALKTILWSQIEKKIGASREKHGVPEILLAVVVIILAIILLSGGIYFLFGEFKILGGGYFAVLNFPTLNLLSDGNQVPPEIPEIPDSDIPLDPDKPKCDLGGGSWDIWLGDLRPSAKDPSQYYLPPNKDRGLFKYSENIHSDIICEFSFIPLSDSAVNFVISFDEFYQVVIGDNNYKTISLRASSGIEQGLEPITELNSSSTRPRLEKGNIKKGSVVNIVLDQGAFGDDKYKVEVWVDYLPDIDEGGGRAKQPFVFIFDPSPSVFLDALDLSVGFIRGIGDSSDIGADFIIPIPVLEYVESDKR